MSTKIIDMNLYDRMTRTYGQKAMVKIINSAVCIYGLSGGYGTEIAKNLALSGIKHLYLFDNELINNHDIISSYYYTDKDKDKPRNLILSEYIKELNPYLTIECIDISNIKDKQFDTIIVINQNIKKFTELNNYFRTKNIKSVYLNSSGVSGYIFVDVCNNHTVLDTTGEIYESIIVTDLNSNGIVTCKNHPFINGNKITFSELDGDMLYFLQNREFIISNISRNSFQIDIENNNFTFKNGVVNYVYQPQVFNHEPFETQNTNRNIIGFEQDKSNLLIDTLNRLVEFGKYPPWSKEMTERLKLFSNNNLEMIIRSYGIELPPVVSIMGGFASTEVMKLVMNKYTPFSQWFTWEDTKIFTNKNVSEYDSFGIGSLFGKEYVSKLKNLNISIVGCGALGCEWLKNLVLLNASTNKGVIKVTDHDHIEKSNLSRQFLFRPNNIGKSKSKTAHKSVMKNYISNIEPYEEKLTHENINFTQSFFNNCNIVINALDNIEARKFVDKMCFENGLPLFESGTMGMKGNTQPVIPFLTETYSNSQDPEEEKQFAVCTIKNFPNSIVHTIHWARDYFEFFNRVPNNINNYNKDPSYLDILEGIDRNQAINDINEYYSRNINTYEDCILWAKDIFEKEYNHSIKQLLHCFPKDHMMDNNLFWSNGKRCPNPLNFNDNEVLVFINTTAKLLCRCFNIKEHFTSDMVKHILLLNPLKDFIPNNQINIAKNDSEIKDNDTRVNLLENIKIKDSICYPQEFEKDDDTNWHIEWITSASNCRAISYGIEPVSNYKTKGIAGKIIPAIATTTSTIVGLISFELMKYINECDNIEDYSSWFVNMADNTTISAEPIIAPIINIGDKKINSWTKFNFSMNNTIKQLIEKYKNIIGKDIEMVLYDTTIIYSNFLENEMDVTLKELLITSYNIDVTTTKVNLTLICEDEDIPLVELF